MGSPLILIPAGGSATPGGSSGDIQYNNSGALGGVTVVPAANGGVANLITSGQGFFWGYGLIDNSVGGTSTVIAPTGNNNVLVWQFVIPFRITVRKITFSNGSTVTAAATATFGIYDISGNKLIDSGTFSTAVASQTVTNTLGTPVTLNPGVYWFAQSCSNTSNTSSGNINDSAAGRTMRNASGVRQGTAANSASSGVLPSTLGTVTGTTNRVPVAVFFEA